ncbi:Allophanate hydrolase 2 subunit 1 [Pseudoalteromonas luteoviolacea B = ATCC 29581]|nr:Allophanate hydrolase 2 subunit 1 [Pseudoalteromonas luteoviolacea B = ATCC 29581]
MMIDYCLSPTVVVFALEPSFDRNTSSFDPRVFLAIKQRCQHSEDFIDIVPTATSITLYLSSSSKRKKWQEYLKQHWQDLHFSPEQARHHRIPTHYGSRFGQDLEHVCEQLRISQDTLISLHASQHFVVQFMGFLPGFGYLGDLDRRLQIPRKETPLTHVPKGSVAIAEHMSAIYPKVSPGGWHLIGHTDVCLFDPTKSKPCLFSPGDIVQFEAVND